MKELVEHAWKNRYAVGYFESWDLISTLAVIDAAEKMAAPVIIGFNGGFLVNQERNVKENVFHYGAMGKAIAHHARVPVALLLNECQDFPTMVQGILAGFNGVMYTNDRGLSLQKAIALVKRTIDVAHTCGVYVEGEVGHLPTADGEERLTTKANLSDPEEAIQFVRETGVDALSVSVGNVHLLEKGKARLNHSLIEAIEKAVHVPLVLHGGTGIDEHDIRTAISLGVSKINVGTLLKRVFLESLASSFADPQVEHTNVHDLLGRGGKDDILSRARTRLAEEASRFISLFGSAGRKGLG
ncbi:MAG: class II fructose-bisphosphate aldolase [Atribacterota bacterium]